MSDYIPNAVVVGAGPVGCLTAISLAKMGWEVVVYEGRPDMRLPASKAAAQQRSINLAISSRGITALQAVLGPAATDNFLQTVIPMRGRMIHHVDGKLDSQVYDRHGQCINSIDRALLNESLLSEAINTPNVRVFFRHKVQSIDFDKKSMTVRNDENGTDVSTTFDLCVGADGSYSVVRRQLMRVVRMDFEQSYIPHEYMELKMPAGTSESGGSSFLLDPDHLHIWPRHSFMLIALPNKDKTFTCTLFAPTASFDELAASTREEQVAWFKTYFPDALKLIGEDAVLNDLARNPRSPLISIKARPYHYRDCAVILGDAAHSMVPFYGQGLNCGLEDVRVLTSIIREEARKNAGSPSPSTATDRSAPRKSVAHLGAALERYSETRYDDLIAISDLAMHNYIEMRHDVTTPAYLLRKAVDNLLAALTSPPPTVNAQGQLTYTAGTSLLDDAPFNRVKPRGWLPLYTMVTFRPDIPYSVAREKAEFQARVLSVLGWAIGGATTAALAAAGTAWWTGVLRRR